MKIGIIGAGFTGLAAAIELQKKGHTVTLFEKEANPGGLALGFKEKKWEWTLEQHYHHWFTNDDAILNLAKELNYPVVIKRPKSSFYINEAIYQFDSPKAMLTFPLLSVLDRVRMAGFFALLFKINPFWKPLERYKITQVIPKLIGTKAYEMLWEPQLENKMGRYTNQISLVWFWARIRKRTTHLAYPQKGYLAFAEFLSEHIIKNKGIIHYSTELSTIKETTRKTIRIESFDKNRKKTNEEFDKVLVTLPTHLLLKTVPSLPQSYVKSIKKLEGLGATNMVLRLKKPFFADKTYWLSICDKKSPILVIVEHTNFMDKRYYNNEHIVYLGNYLSLDNPDFAKSKTELMKKYEPYLLKLNPNFKNDLIDYELFKAPFAQPIIPVNYSRSIPSFITPFENLFLANMQQVYPWDRGTNYAVELGQKVATIIDTHQ